MAKKKTCYRCSECGAESYQWSGKCQDCGAWNSLVEVIKEDPKKDQNPRFRGYAGEQGTLSLANVSLSPEARISTKMAELDRVLGGGLVLGSVILIGGDPGIGKSTILLQTMANIAQDESVLYVTGEESLRQVSMRARRLNLEAEKIKLLTETSVSQMIAIAQQEKPKIMVIDSIQAVYSEELQSAPGSVGQVREVSAQLVRFAKQTGTTIFLVGHVTKDGAIAGPRVLEHMVDTVLYFESDSGSRYRMIRAVKNRFGAVNELGVFAMTETGLKEVGNPSAIFLSRHEQEVSGSVVMATREGTRPMLVEVQALVDETHLSNPRRVTLGLEQNRLSMLLAVLHKHSGVPMYDQDVYVNVVGGIRVTETGSDLAVILAILSSYRNRPFERNSIAFGEVGLSGEIRPIQGGEDRLKEAAKHGFTKAYIPKQNVPSKSSSIKGIEIITVDRLEQALNITSM